jgi:hypothetical protein
LVRPKPIVVCRLKISAPTFDVMMMIVLRKSILRPSESVILPFFENLQQQMHHVRVRLFDFVEKHHRVRPTPHRFGKLAALFVTDISRRRTDQTRCREFLHVLRHVDLNERVAIAEHEFGRVCARKVLPTPVGPRKMNEPIGRADLSDRRGNGVSAFADRGDGFVLADDTLPSAPLPS